jgi:hypothetical protein
MTLLEDQIRDLYRQVTDTEQPRARVSIAEALRRGRVLRRRRRLSAVGAPVVAAVAVAGIALGTTLPAHANRGAQANRVPSLPLIANPPPLPGQFDPLVVNMSFGWLPPGEAALTGGTGMVNGSLTVYQERNLNMNSYTSRDANTRWRLSEYARSICTFDGRQHRLLCNGQSILSGPAPDINGHRAFWESGYGPHHPALVWEYAPGYWAELVRVGLLQSGQTLLRIARGVSFGGDAIQPVKFAVQLTGVPSGWHIGSTFVTRVSGNWLAQDGIVTTGKRVLWADAVGTYNGLPEVTTYVGGGNCNQLYQFPAPPQWRRINGYQVETATNPLDPTVTSLCAPHANGLLVLESLQSRPHGPRISLTSLFQHMRVLGSRPSAWTTHPIG